ncbi:NAD-dependent epimerase/dehydratase family protein [Mumia sp. zg.B53]|uniref:NAD-dependent epimerase/dehydratase family protein n=1 Tax=unclassified Mumia TaxID=2621872 RepID=UPI001C6E6FC4|nr:MULTISPECIES: NAD-dependent epimerase/dehydratase family protein [unclassified Mumia]MBW9209468.1 NAD-dependent epimerase/dehydratase family protein [Mumia sp. zg.B21]MBW9214073.1 NAD-dependent epimerase/dehydratase family protein [Mumia sp. zg.B53]MDD9348643.1 NAD-dependent epimerase/dehydratase family protein [Mumia sp.]
MGRVVLVTGVARDLGSRLARRLAVTPGIDKVVGLDVQPPPGDIHGIKYVRADIRTPVIGKVLAVEDVDTVVHMNVGAPQRQLGSRSAVKEINVIGTMQLLAACQNSRTVERLVVQSSTAVYGTSARNPAMFTEHTPSRSVAGSGFPKDAVDIEAYVRGFGRRRPDVTIATFRLGNVLAADVLGPFSEYLQLPVLPAMLGYDPRLQFLHPFDALNVLSLAATGDVTGTYNVVGPQVLALSQAARRLGRPLLRLPSVGFNSVTQRMVRMMSSDFTPELARLFKYGRVCDGSKLERELGYEMLYSTPQTLDAFAETIEPGVLSAMGGTRV